MQSDELIAGRYRFERMLGRGGMGEVLQVHDQATSRSVALKRLRVDARRDKLRRLFEREYHTLARLSHPSIIEVFDYGVSDDFSYYTMELLDGIDLHRLAPLPYPEACGYLRDVAHALSLLHSRQLLHRDLSGRNVRLTGSGRAKLIDFGVLSPFGIARDVVGSPPMVPPETLGDSPLDQRADLYSLGALAYHLLTGRHAYAARELSELPALWAARITPPSRLVELPKTLTDLIEALLSVHPQGRPHSAAEVIDRLNAITSLRPDAISESTRTQLPAPNLVGREAVVAQIEVAYQLAAADGGGTGAGSAITLSGGAGMGKTRLLAECAIEAQLRGLEVAQVAMRDHAPGEQLLRRLVAAVFVRVPELASRALQTHGAWLAEHVPSGAGVAAPPAPPKTDAYERRARTLSDLRAWLLEIARERPLALIIDDVHLASEEDAAIVALLAHSASAGRLVVLAGLGAFAHAGGSEALDALRRFSQVVPLDALTRTQTEALVHSMFGVVPHTVALAAWLHKLGAGNPGHCIELSRQLLTAGTLRYIGGTWVLPRSLDLAPLPVGDVASSLPELENLSGRARALADALCLCRGPLSISLAWSLCEERADVYATLDELVEAGILMGLGDDYAFRQELTRTGLQAQLPAARRTELHTRITRALLAMTELDQEQRIEAAYHGLRGEDPLAGAELLSGMALDLIDRQGRARRAVPALEAALEVYRARGFGPERSVALLLPLVVAGMYSDRKLMEKYGEPAVDALLAILRVADSPASQLAGHPLLQPLLTSAVALASVINATCDTAAGQRLLHKLSPLRAFGADSVVGMMLSFIAGMLSEGDEAGARAALRAGLARLDRDDVVLPPDNRLALLAGLHNALGMLLAAEADDGAEQHARLLESLGHRRYATYAAQIRVIACSYRGDSAGAQREQEQADLYSLEGAGSWRADIWIPCRLILAQLLIGDVVGLKRTADHFAALATEVPTLSYYRDLAQMGHELLRGRFESAAAKYEGALEAAAESGMPGWAAAHGGYAWALNETGRHAEALALCTTSGSQASMLRDAWASRVWLERQAARAEAGLGRGTKGEARLQALIEEIAPSDNALLLAVLHCDLASSAVRLRAPMRFEQHRELAHGYVARVDHAGLSARYERLLAEAQGMERSATARRK